MIDVDLLYQNDIPEWHLSGNVNIDITSKMNIFNNLNFSGVNLSGLNLSWADFQNKDLKNTNFQNSNLQNVSFQNADLRHANFRNADLTDAVYDEDTWFSVGFDPDAHGMRWPEGF